MNRYQLIISLLLCIWACQVSRADRPNIIFILADDLGYGDLGCYGQQHFETPHLDRLAQEGMRFTQHYSGSTVCAPSRACLHTGLHTGHTYQRFNGKVEFRPDPQDTTVARLLARAGYRTGLIGKSGLSGHSQNGQLPNEKGFDHFFGFTSHRLAHRYYPERLWRNGQAVRFSKNKGKEGKEYSGDLFLREALEFIDRNHHEQPFYLHLSLQQPHADLSVPRQWKEPFLGKFEEQPFAGNGYRAEEFPKATYAGMITHLNFSVGQIISKLRQLRLDENTLVIFSSDNGPMSEGGWDKKYFDSNGPLRGGKRDLYEGGIRVPMIAWWPGRVAAGSESAHISAFWDFLPTACELAGEKFPTGIDGISYAPTLLGKAQTTHDYLYWEFYEQGGKQAVRSGRWKGVRLNVHDNPSGQLEVYDLRLDVSESRDVSQQEPKIAEHLAALMSQAHVDSELVTFGSRR